MYHTASVVLYRRDAKDLNEPNNCPFATACNRYVLIQYDVYILLERMGLDCQQKQDALRKEAVFCSESCSPRNTLHSDINTKRTVFWHNLDSHMSLQGMSRNSSGGIVSEPRWISKEC